MSDMEKSAKIWQAMNETTGENKPFPAAQIAEALALCSVAMAEEDPHAPTLCSSCGEYYPSREINVWGLCTYCQPR